MERAKSGKDPSATVSPELSCHEIFEKWRVHDVHSLDAQQLEEYRVDVRESNRRYDHSYEEVLAHTSEEELEEFWDLFKIKSGGGMPIGLSRKIKSGGRDRHMSAGQTDSGQRSPTAAQTEAEVEVQAPPRGDSVPKDDDFSVANPMRTALQSMRL